METKFFSEIEKKMNVKTLKDFEKEVSTKIINQIAVYWTFFVFNKVF